MEADNIQIEKIEIKDNVDFKEGLVSRKIVAIEISGILEKVQFLLCLLAGLFFMSHLFFKTFNTYVLLLDATFLIISGLSFYFATKRKNYLKEKYQL